MNTEEIISEVHTTVSKEDSHDSTVQSIEEISKLMTKIERKHIESIVALGSGRGGLPYSMKSIYNASVVHAVDVNDKLLKTAEKRGLEVHNVDLETEQLPFDTDSIDLVVSFGLLEHLTWYDNVIAESKRVLRDDGYILCAMPNLGGWTNRLSLFLGRQPRNIEFSRQRAFGIMNAYGTNKVVGHVHAPTVTAFKEFLEFNDFRIVDTVGLHPYQDSYLIETIDWAVARRPSLCRRFATLARYRPDCSPS